MHSVTDPAPGSPRAALALLLCMLTACAGQPAQLDPEALASLPSGHLIDGLPFHPQVEDQCGPASLATMLAARGVWVEPESLRGQLYIPDKAGAVTTEMVARARRFGLLVYPLQPELVAILQEVAAGNPVLVMQNLSLEWLPRWHYSVVIGFDLPGEFVVLRSGDEPAHEVPFALFRNTWTRADRWAVVLVAPHDLPATAREDVFVRSASDLEQVGELDSALAAYRTAMAAWPGSDTALFGAGNTAYALGDYGQAAALFSDFVRMRPLSAAGWNNLAYSLGQLDCHDEGLRAAQCAMRLEPGNQAVGESLAGPQSAGATGACHQAPPCPY